MSLLDDRMATKEKLVAEPAKEVWSGQSAVASADDWLARAQHAVDEVAESGLDAEELAELSKAIRDTALRVSSEVVPELEPEAANRVNERLIAILSLDPEETGAVGAADSYVLGLEGVRHILRDQLREDRPEGLRRESGEVIAMLEAWLPAVGGAEVAELLGQSVRQVQRRRLAAVPASQREQLVVRLVATLRHAWTDAGVVAWFHRVRPELGGAAPIELLDDPGREHELLVAARSGRVQGGA